MKFGGSLSLSGLNAGLGYATSTKEGGFYYQWELNPNSNPNLFGISVGTEVIYFTDEATDRSLDGAISGRYRGGAVSYEGVSVGYGEGLNDENKAITKSASFGIGVKEGFSWLQGDEAPPVTVGGSFGETTLIKTTD